MRGLAERFIRARGRRLHWCVASVLLIAQTPSLAEVVRIEIARRESFAGRHAFGNVGPYERVVGKLYCEVDPEQPANTAVVDLKLAPRNERGRVEFWTDFFLLMPADPLRGNRRLFYDVNNRGNKLAMGAFNNQGGNDPSTLADAGNGFLMRQGYAILWCGWNGDVRAGDGRMQIGLPVARQDGKPITGRLYAEICVDAPAFSQPFYWGNSNPYPAVSLDHTSAVLTMRPRRSETAQSVPHDQWAFARYEDGQVIPDATQLYVKEGFKPGWLYELVYEGKEPRVTGLGFAAVRDAVSFFRHAEGVTNPLAGAIDRAYVFGISQSGRFIHHFVYQGFNGDERGRAVFDGALAHVGGGGRGLFNSRFAQTTRHGSHHEDNLFPSDSFPFTSVEEVDPVTGRRGDILSAARARGPVPKMFFTETSTEYWARAASRLHTDVEGRRDVAPVPEVRLYFLTGAQHGVSSSMDKGIYEHPRNVLDHRPLLRALLVALDRWVSRGEEPPPNTYPRIADGTLVTLEEYQRAFPRIAGVTAPESFYAPLRLDFGPRWATEGIADYVPPRVGPAYVTLLPAVDADGNERAGIRLPDVAVPLGTYAGWNTRAAAYGAEGMLGRWAGSYWPLARTQAERAANGDARLSLAERYGTHDVYLSQVARAATELHRRRLLLDEDVVAIVQAAIAREWSGER